MYWLKLLVIMSNFIPKKTILADDSNPSWFTSKIKGMIQEKNLFYKKYLKPNYQETLQAFTQIQERVRLAIENSKKKYYEKLLNKPLNNKLGKCYWTILTRFLTKKILCRLPYFMRISLLLISLKRDILERFSRFAKQCSLLNNESWMPPQFFLHINTCLSTVRFSENVILKVIKIRPE